MRKLFTAVLLLAAAQTVQAANWSPIVNGWYKDYCVYGASRAEKAINSSVSYDGLITGVTEDAKAGRYPSAPMPYRQDMLPAVVQPQVEDWDATDYDTTKNDKIIIPLKNAHYAGIPIKSYAFADRDGFTWYAEFNFGVLSQTQEKRLFTMLNRKGELSPLDYFSDVSFRVNEDNELLLICDAVTVG